MKALIALRFHPLKLWDELFKDLKLHFLSFLSLWAAGVDDCYEIHDYKPKIKYIVLFFIATHGP